MATKNTQAKTKTNTNTKTKTKKMTTEPEMCTICMNNYTSILRKKVVCRFCNADTCSKCIERYLLDRIEDAHCLHCHVNYNDSTLPEICTKTYLQHTYFKHRQAILINRERANLPGLQDAALHEKQNRLNEERINWLAKELNELGEKREKILIEYNIIYAEYYRKLTDKDYADKVRASDLRQKMDILLIQSERLRDMITVKNDEIRNLRWTMLHNGATGDGTAPKDDERKKFIRRCTRNNCQGFLSTAWKCGICEFYSCSKCFVPKTQKHDDPHECAKEDLETADMIKKDSKPCPNCGEFIMKSSGCSQMFCISCKTPWDWNTGKVVTTGIIHNPHYYEWMRRNGNTVPRNPADVPCGGYPDGWGLRRMPRGMSVKTANIFYEFHRICLELQDISERTYRSHIDNTTTNSINVRFLLGDFDEAHWGQLLAKNERKRKRDGEVQEIFAAFRMVAVELINRVQNYTADGIPSFTYLNLIEAEKFIENLGVEILALITMINTALRAASISYNYSVPFIHINGGYYSIKTKNFSDEVKKKRVAKKDVSDAADADADEDGEEGEDDSVSVTSASASATATIKSAAEPATNKVITKRYRPNIAPIAEDAMAIVFGTTTTDEDTELQAAIEASLSRS